MESRSTAEVSEYQQKYRSTEVAFKVPKCHSEYRSTKVPECLFPLDTNTDAPFAGVNIIFFGDYLQYSPVLDSSVTDPTNRG